MSSLDQRIAEAAAMGMSYGQYMAYRKENGFTEILRNIVPIIPAETVKVGVCIVCGGDIMRPNKRGNPNTCSPACRDEINRRRALNRYHEKKKEHPEGREHICAVCGKAFRGEPRMKYCNEKCRAAANLENTKNRYRRKVNGETLGE